MAEAKKSEDRLEWNSPTDPTSGNSPNSTENPTEDTAGEVGAQNSQGTLKTGHTSPQRGPSAA